MKIVIDIPEETYEYWKTHKHEYVISEAITNGIILPEEHGRLIDGDLLEYKLYHQAFEVTFDLQKWDSGCWIRYKMFENVMKEIPTIVNGG